MSAKDYRVTVEMITKRVEVFEVQGDNMTDAHLEAIRAAEMYDWYQETMAADEYQPTFRVVGNPKEVK